MQMIKKIVFLHATVLFIAILSCSNYNTVILISDASAQAFSLKEKLDRSKHFIKYTNPSNGVVSYILNTHIAKHQISMYFVVPPVTDDGRYIWFWLTEGSGDFDIALFDVEKDEIRHYSGMKIHASSSFVDTETGEVFWVKPAENQRHIGDNYLVLKRGPGEKDKIKQVAYIPHLVDNCRVPRQVVTHLSRSADKKSFAFDSGHYRENNRSYLGTVPLDIKGQYSLWTILDRRYNHAQMHPVHNDVMLAAQDYFTDYIGQYGEAGGRIGVNNRMWILYADGEAKPVFADLNNNSVKTSVIYHEYWGNSGEYLWYIDQVGTYGGNGTCRIPYHYATRSFGAPELIWPKAGGHSFSSRSERYLVGDHGYKSWETTDSCRVSFYNMETKKEVDIATKMPYSGEQNHPHPTFAMNDQVICYTFAITGRNSLAITFTDQLIEKSK